MKGKEHSYSIAVSKREIDDLQHVNNVAYLNYVQDAAENHWKILSNPNIDAQFIWVVVRHEIDYLKQAVLNDTLLIHTWVGESSGVRSIRFVDIKRNNLLIARAKTTWCLLDKKSMRPVRIPKEIIQILYN
jgi:acyl-CoA thioester hydrolase